MRGCFAITAMVVLLFGFVVGADEQDGAGGHSRRTDKDVRDETGDVSGVVTDGDGSPVAHALILLKEDEEADENFGETVSARDGSFFMEDVEAGVYVVVVRKMGFDALVQKGVPVLAGQEIQLRLVVQRVVLGSSGS